MITSNMLTPLTVIGVISILHMVTAKMAAWLVR